MGKRSIFSLVAALGLILLIQSAVVGAEEGWRTYQNDTRNTGVAAGVAPGENVSLDWRMDPDGGVISSPAVVEGTVFVGTYSGPFVQTSLRLHGGGTAGAADRSGELLAIDATTGNVSWRLSTDASIASSPTVADGTVYVASLGGTVYAVDAGTGDVDWTRHVGSRIYAPPTVADGTLYVGSRSDNDHQLSHRSFPFYALDTDDGGIVWERGIDEGVVSAAAVTESTVIIGGLNGTLHVVNASDGSTEWTYSTSDVSGARDPLMRYGAVTTAPTIAEDSLYIGTYAGEVVALNRTTTAARWTHRTDGPVVASPAVTSDRVFAGSYDGTMYAFDAATGDTAWRYRTRGRISKSSPVVVDGYLYFGNAGSRIADRSLGSPFNGGRGDNRVFAVDGDDGSVVWSYYTDYWVYSSPAVAESGLYVASLDEVLSFDNNLTDSRSSENDTGNFTIHGPNTTKQDPRLDDVNAMNRSGVGDQDAPDPGTSVEKQGNRTDSERPTPPDTEGVATSTLIGLFTVVFLTLVIGTAVYVRRER